MPSALWSCPECSRTFRQKNQVHSCGTGDRDGMLEKKPKELAALYVRLEKQVERWAGVELVYKRSYVLFRTTRVFTDLVFMKTALRLALLLDYEEKDPLFFKRGRMSKHRVAHVALIRTPAELRKAMPYLKAAHRFALEERKKK